MLDKHNNSNKHLQNMKAIVGQPRASTLFGIDKQKTLENKIKSSEILISCFLVKNNLLFNLAGEVKQLLTQTCPDSEIAKNLKLERTKAHAIVSNVTGKVAKSNLIQTLRTEKFSLVVDESTDRSCTKHLAVIVRTAMDLKVEDHFLCLIPIIHADANHLHDVCVDFFKKADIPYKKNMIGFAADGANAMFGQHHSLSTLFLNDIPNLFVMKCICHSFHLCASYACKKLPKFVQEFARHVYNFIQKSPKRIGDYKEFQEYIDIKPHKLLKPCQTRWLSLLPVVKRLLEQLSALKLYFQSCVLVDKIEAAKPLLDDCLNPATELYLQFLNFAIPFFHDLNKEMQATQPKLFVFYEKVFTTYKAILECFIQPKYMQPSESDDSDDSVILKIDYKNRNVYLPMDEIYFGGNVLKLLNDPELVKKISKEDILTFRKNCLRFYIEGLDQITARFSFESSQQQKIKALQFMNPQLLLNGKATSTIVKAALLFKGFATEDLTELDREWRILRHTKFPFSSDVNVEEFWRHIANMKKGDGDLCFPLVCEFIKKLLTLPHSSANVERLFSSINLIKTCNRNRLTTATLEGILHTKRFIEKENCEPNKNHFALFNKNMYN